MLWKHQQRTLVSLLANLVLGALEGLRGRVDAARDGFGGGVGVFPDQKVNDRYVVRDLAVGSYFAVSIVVD